MHQNQEEEVLTPTNYIDKRESTFVKFKRFFSSIDEGRRKVKESGDKITRNCVSERKREASVYDYMCDEDDEDDDDIGFCCAVCNGSFMTMNKLLRHSKKTGHYEVHCSRSVLTELSRKKKIKVRSYYCY